MTRESMSFDVVIVGAGPAGLSTAIQYAKLCKQNDKPIRVCILEKGSEVGAHILSGAVFETKALNTLIPEWKDQVDLFHTPATEDIFQILSKKRARRLPTPPQMHNHGNYIISLGQLCRWLATKAEALGIEIYPGFAGSDIIYDQDRVVGIGTNPSGISKTGEKKLNYQPGMALLAQQTVLAEGCRGSLSEQVMKHYDLRKNVCPQTYGLGIKELWEVEPRHHRKGTVIHTIGWPLDRNTYGGSFIYHWDKNLVSIGLVIGLDYHNPYLNPYEEFQQLKRHPSISPTFEGGRCISYGARALNEGGWQSIPKLSFPGGLLVGCGAGFMNVPKIKGSHTAMQSGILAGEALFKTLHAEKPVIEINSFTKTVKSSWIGKELKKVRNIRPSFRAGLFTGLVYAAFDTYFLRGHAPWTFKNKPDYESLVLAKNATPLVYPKPDGILTFDKMTSVSRTNVFHEEDQPAHLTLKNTSIPIEINLKLYAGPEQRYCPAGVYEFITTDKPRLQINAQNCIHCKTCDIKDPKQNIVWQPPEGGGGPNYGEM